MGFFAAFGGTTVAVQAITPVAGFTLQNATPTIVSWTAPNDGKSHSFVAMSVMHVTSNATGGECNVNWITPDGATADTQIHPGSFGVGVNAVGPIAGVVGPGQVVKIYQFNALSAGAAVVFSSIWGL